MSNAALGISCSPAIITIPDTERMPGSSALAKKWTPARPRWTNGAFKSTLHRVVSSSGQERYSIAYFFEPALDAVVECLPQCCGPDR